MKYYIPIYGWIIAIREWVNAVDGYKAVPDATTLHRTMTTFRNTQKGFVATIGTLGILMLVVMFWRFL